MNLSEWFDKHPKLKWLSFITPGGGAAYIVSKLSKPNIPIENKEEIKKKPLYWVLVGVLTAILGAAIYFVIQKIKSFSK